MLLIFQLKNSKKSEDKGKRLIDRTMLENISKKESVDTGMVLALILVAAGLIFDQMFIIKISIAVLLINMVYPALFKPFAFLWFGLAKILGAIVPKLLLTIIFFLVVLPIGIIWRIIGKDPLKLKEWKQGSNSVMKTRNHIYSAEDIQHPY